MKKPKTKKLKKNIHAPTGPQVGFLEARGIAVPPTKKIAGRLINFIKKGNGAGVSRGMDEYARTELLKEFQDEWHGRRVRTRVSDEEEGEALYIIPKTPAEVGTRVTFLADPKPAEHVHPFSIFVAWDKGPRAGSKSAQTMGDVRLLPKTRTNDKSDESR